MKRKAVVRHVTLGALATSLVPLTAPGAGAGQHDRSAAGICRSAFGDRGPTEGPVVGEGPSGDSMVVSVGWNPGDWPGGGIGRIVTCVSVDGRAIPELATSTVNPPNTGSLMLDLTLPAGEPGSLVCEQSVLVGKGGGPGRTPPTSPECFKLRASNPPPPTKAGGRTSVGAPTPDAAAPGRGVPASDPAGQPAPAPAGRRGSGSAVAGPPGPPAPVGPPASADRMAGRARSAATAGPASTPPGRSAFESAGAPGTPTARTTSPRDPARTPAAAPAAAGAAAPAASPAATDAAGAPAAALARTGVENRIPLAGAGVLLALGGAAIIFGEPRRRTWNTRPA